ncbi:hypothetical protein [Mycobacterium attenuatum]|nr:hypothetical protein [Mycobacterium attenuatum]
MDQRLRVLREAALVVVLLRRLRGVVCLLGVQVLRWCLRRW